MNLSSFDFDLPAELIAQRPLEKRDASRLMVLNRETGAIIHDHFSNFPDHLTPGDVLVLNNTEVRPVRFIGRKTTGGKVDVLLVRPAGPLTWEVLVKGTRSGRVIFSDELYGEIRQSDKGMAIEFNHAPDTYMDESGLMPLPPYIRRMPDQEDRSRYQTVYAEKPGAIAAPTAGLHFTPGMLDRLKQRGVQVGWITLHVGIGTFMPVKEEDLSRHRMPPEPYSLPEETVDLVNLAKAEGRRIIPVGTTSTRTLEAAGCNGRLHAGEGSTGLFIYPGYRFSIVDGLLTNFHLPKGTPLMLVSALAGMDLVRRAYREAVQNRYRFFSYGDAMLVR